jgi:hypothetical protein
MELAESVGLIGPASRTHDLHAAIQRFHDLICVNATIKAAKMAADAIHEVTPPAAPTKKSEMALEQPRYGTHKVFSPAPTPPAAQRQRVVFPTMLRKMWSGSEVQAWLDENVNKENT